MIRMSDIDRTTVDREQSRPTLPMFGLHYTTALIFACNSGTAAANVPFDIRAEHYLPSAGMPAASCLCHARGWLSNVTYRVGGNFRLATNQKLANSATVRYPTSTSVHAKACCRELTLNPFRRLWLVPMAEQLNDQHSESIWQVSRNALPSARPRIRQP